VIQDQIASDPGSGLVQDQIVPEIISYNPQSDNIRHHILLGMILDRVWSWWISCDPGL